MADFELFYVKENLLLADRNYKIWMKTNGMTVRGIQ
jgi:hypothetical protein